MNPIGVLTGVSKAVDAGEAAPATLGAVGAPPLPEPTAGWTDATTAALAALAEFFQKSREGMREVKKAFDASRQAQMAKEVESMRKQADEIRTGAVVQGVMLGASATAGAFALATSSGTASEPAAKDTPEACRPTAPAPTTPDTTPSAPANATPGTPANPPAGSDAPAATNKTSKWLELGSKTARDFADPVKTAYEARAKECEADGAAARANAERAKSNAEDMQGMADSQGELAAKAMDAIRAVLEARHAATMAVLSQRG